MYALMHAVQDSFSAAHVARDDQGRILHLMSWTLIDWPSYLLHGRASFPGRDRTTRSPTAATETSCGATA